MSQKHHKHDENARNSNISSKSVYLLTQPSLLLFLLFLLLLLFFLFLLFEPVFSNFLGVVGVFGVFITPLNVLIFDFWLWTIVVNSWNLKYKRPTMWQDAKPSRWHIINLTKLPTLEISISLIPLCLRIPSEKSRVCEFEKKPTIVCLRRKFRTLGVWTQRTSASSCS